MNKLSEEMTMIEAVKQWLGYIAEIDPKTGIHPEGVYFLHNVRQEFLLNWGDEIAPFLGEK